MPPRTPALAPRTSGVWQVPSLRSEAERACKLPLPGDGALERGASSLRLGWRKEGEGAYLVRGGCVRMSRGPAGPRRCRRLGCEAVLGWWLPECGCVCPKPLQHLCIRMCSSLSSLLACALPRSLPTTTPLSGEGIFFFFFFLLPLPHLPQSKDQSGRQSDLQHHA